MAGYGTNGLYTLDTVTGEATLVATVSRITGLTTPWPITGVESHKGELYVTMVGLGRLYRVDLDTLAGTQIGADDFGPADETHPYDIASHGSPAELYMIGAVTDSLYKINAETGEATRVGDADAFDAGETEPLALASHGGRLYMTGGVNDCLYEMNTATGKAARVGRRRRFRCWRIARIRHSDRVQRARGFHARCRHGASRLHRRCGCARCQCPVCAGVRRQDRERRSQPRCG